MTIEIGTEVRSHNALLDGMVRACVLARSRVEPRFLAAPLARPGPPGRLTGPTRQTPQETDMGQARGLLNGTMQRLTAFSNTAHGKQFMYLTAFVLFVFFVIYYLIR